MDLLQEYKYLYDKEIERSHKLNDSMGNSIVLLSIIGGGNLFLFQKYFSDYSNLFCKILTLISALCFVFTIIFFVRAYSGYYYSFFPIGEMSDKINQTNKVVEDAGFEMKKAEKHIYGMFERTYCKCASNNLKENIKKSERHKLFTSITLISFAFLAFTYTADIIISAPHTQ